MNKKILLLSVLALSACSSHRMMTTSVEQDIEQSVIKKLDESVLEIEKSKAELKQIELGKTLQDTAINKVSPLDTTVATRVVATAAPLTVAKKGIDTNSQTGKKISLEQLNTKVDLHWKGDATIVVKELAKRIGYVYQEEGKRKPIPIHFTAKNEEIRSVLKEVDTLAKGKIDIKVDSVARQIKVTHK